MFPTLNDREIHRTEVRQFTYNQISDPQDTSHVNPVTDILLDSASSFPKGCEVVSFDPINQESEIVSESVDKKVNSYSSDSEASGSEDTVRERRMMNKRSLRRTAIIIEKLQKFKKSAKSKADTLIQLNRQQRAWNANVIHFLESVAFDLPSE